LSMELKQVNDEIGLCERGNWTMIPSAPTSDTYTITGSKATGVLRYS